MISVKRKIYRAVAVATSLVCLLMTGFTWYVVGLIEKESAKDTLESRVSYVSNALYKKGIKYESALNQVKSDYKSKARALAVMLSTKSDITDNELILEELLAASGADAISFFDENLKLEFTTGSAKNTKILSSDFKPAVTDKLYSKAIIDTSNEQSRIIVACSRLDNPGVIQVEYVSECLDTIIRLLDVSDIFEGIPIMKSGSIALIDNRTMKYIAHTDTTMFGKPSHFTLEEDFKADDPFFDCEINGENVLLHFDFCNNQLVIGYIPYAEINSTRNDTTQWVICVALIVSVVVTLTVRSKILHINKKKKIQV